MVEKSTAEESNPAVIGVLFLFFCPMQCYIWHVRYVLRTVWDMAVELQWWHSSCWHFLAHGNHFLPTVTLFGFPPRGKRSAVDSLLFCASSFLSIYGSFLLFLFLFFSVPVLLSQSCLLCFFLSLSLYSGVLPPPPLLSPYSQSFRPYCKLALMASSCSSLSRL